MDKAFYQDNLQRLIDAAANGEKTADWTRLGRQLEEAIEDFISVCPADDYGEVMELADSKLIAVAEYRLARCWRRRNRYDEAIELLEDLMKRADVLDVEGGVKRKTLHFALGECYRGIEYFGSAGQNFERAAELSDKPDYRRMSYGRAACCYYDRGNKMPEAARCAEAEAEYAEGHDKCRALTFAAKCHSHMGDYVKAEELLDQADLASNDPKDIEYIEYSRRILAERKGASPERGVPQGGGRATHDTDAALWGHGDRLAAKHLDHKRGHPKRMRRNKWDDFSC